MPSTTLGKVATGVAGTTGMSTVIISALAALRASQAHAIPVGVWFAAVGAGAVAGLVASLGIILEYRLRRLQVTAQSKEAESAAALKRTRLEVLRSIMGEATEHPELAQNYRELIQASALFVSVEQNGVSPTELRAADPLGPASSGTTGSYRGKVRRQRQVESAPQTFAEAEAG